MPVDAGVGERVAARAAGLAQEDLFARDGSPCGVRLSVVVSVVWDSVVGSRLGRGRLGRGRLVVSVVVSATPARPLRRSRRERGRRSAERRRTGTQTTRKMPSRLPGNDGRDRGTTSAMTSAKTMNEAATTTSAVWYPVSASSTRRTLPRCPARRFALLLERRHGETEVPQAESSTALRSPSRPTRRSPDRRAVNPVRERHCPCRSETPGMHVGERVRNALERVVVVVQNDHAPRLSEAAPDPRLARSRGGVSVAGAMGENVPGPPIPLARPGA